MHQLFKNWLNRYLFDPEVVILIGLLLLTYFIFATMGNMLMPVFVSVVLAYLLQWLVSRLERSKCPHVLAVILVYLLFLGALVVGIVFLMPMLWRQLSALFNELPNMLGKGQNLLMHLPERYPDFISPEQMQSWMAELKLDLGKFGQFILSETVTQIPGLITVGVYFILVPLLVYFFLMDKKALLGFVGSYLPKNRQLVSQVWYEVHEQIGNYVRGRVVEIIIVSIVCYILFAIMGLAYAMLLAALVGISVIIPYVGAVFVTIPIIAIAFFQWGMSEHFAYLMLAYALISVLDGNVLVPLLFSEAVQLHPVAIILSVLVFGGFWGFWGVFFAIPLASLVKAILSALPKAAKTSHMVA